MSRQNWENNLLVNTSYKDYIFFTIFYYTQNKMFWYSGVEFLINILCNIYTVMFFLIH